MDKKYGYHGTCSNKLSLSEYNKMHVHDKLNGNFFLNSFSDEATLPQSIEKHIFVKFIGLKPMLRLPESSQNYAIDVVVAGNL